LQQEIATVTTDSRAVTPGCLFAAIRGERSDGHDYIAAAAEKGALCTLCERRPENETPLPLILVENTVTALGDLAAFYRRQFEIPVLGVTGSVGKTTAKEMVAAVLAQKLRVHRTQGNFNNELGVPLTLFGLDETHEAAVVEMGISHFGEMRRLAEIVRPSMALYTAIGSAHLEFLGDFDGVLRAKTEMLDLLPENGVVFVNGDDETLRRLSCRQKLVRFGLSPDCAVRGENVRPLGTEGTALEIVAEGRRIPAHLSAFGGHLATAALGAAAVGLELGLTDAEIAAGLAAYVPVGSRSGLIQTGKLTIIDDCYNANPSSVAAALDSLSGLPARRVSILGDMGELGQAAERLHFETGVYAAEKGIDLIVACGTLSRSTAEGAEKAGGKAVYFAEKEALLEALPSLIQRDDAVLVKASHSRKFEDIVEALKKL
jgi:UDP-N-acetylmuramoyl-tripeptide--D-alanyl-D-alanine ligase